MLEGPSKIMMDDLFDTDAAPHAMDRGETVTAAGSFTAAEPSHRRPRTVFIKSFGCQMNAYDAERMADALAPEGYAETPTMAEADLVILNTCHIRERAAEKVFSELGKVRKLKIERAASGRPLTLAVAGCVAQAEGSEITRRQPAVDLVVGPQSYHRLPALLRATGAGRPIIDTEFPAEDKFGRLVPPRAERIAARGLAAFVTVQEGCDKFCTFCVVPYTRGAEFSRAPAQVLDEVARLAAAGVREVSLLGQNVNAYHGRDARGAVWSLARLIEAVAAVPGIRRIRYTTSHPNDMGEDLIAAHRDVPALMPFLHLPVQSGSDRILGAMNRRHTVDGYRRLVERIRAARPDIALSSDFIVGFPGETEADFAATLALCASIGFASTFSFKYSPRPGTPGAGMADQVDESVRRERLARLQAVVEPQRHAFNAAVVGRTIPVLFERQGRHDGQIVGKSPYLQPVQVQAGTELIGTVRDVAIIAVGPNSLFGRIGPPVDVHGPDATTTTSKDVA